ILPGYYTLCVYIANVILYSIVVRHSITGSDCPATFFFTNDYSMISIARF
ncbi:hypothetical protein BCV72DRAFT_324324, partial [Rhizopus microsporus var. microsporus]